MYSRRPVPGGGDETTISATGEHPFLVARAGPHAAALDTRADPEAVALVEPLDTRDRTGQDRTGQDLAGHGRWVPASDLAEGDAVRTMSPQGVAGTATVTKIRARHAVVPVYNLTVEGTSRYLVGACGVVVHNTNGCGAGGGGGASSSLLDRLSAAARVMDRNMLTKAGRALQKHSNRSGSVYPRAVQNPQSLNSAGQHIVDDILTSPGSKVVPNRHGGIDVVAPDGRGLRYNPDESFRGLLEPQRLESGG
jgi:hypothetical protein